MTLQLFFMKNLRFIFIGAFIILNIYSFYHDVNSFNKVKNFPFPNNTGIIKIDVGQGEDFWILTENYELYHWDAIRGKFILKLQVSGFARDFSVGSDGSVILIFGNAVWIRKYFESWESIYKNDDLRNISICDRNLVFIANYGYLFVGRYYNYAYSWERYATHYINYQVSCAFHDKSLWFIGYDHYVNLFVDKDTIIIRSEVPFKQIKALSEQHVIGIDEYDTLWEYTNGIWTGIKENVRSATINYNGDIFHIDNNNYIYKISKK
ncbi:hypothetical protein RclHR1_03920009 [Rhizophagus clarus]|uniref:Uncharacterized protein n=1 Tax=Rhizophagus clarus TaxID=94130 RepID=A0A2Z6RUE5_9GLOM|nr:hypothetical protein RclHR1_03920009 [Rhizophagus clarus]